MSTLIATDLRGQEVDSALVTLFSLELPNENKVYFHPGNKEDLNSITFRDSESPYTVRTYSPFPIEMEGLELNADGATKRPTVTIANIGSNFFSVLEGYEISDLIGQRITKRQTLRKYLADQSNATPPVEMTNITYIIDRISSETSTAISFEVTVVYDLEGITIPRRVAVGKFCAWQYQGHEFFAKGGCVWPADSNTTTIHPNAGNTAEVTYVHHLYFDLQDRPLITKTWADANISAWSSGTTYNPDDYVSTTDGKYWVSKFTGISGSNKEPSSTSGFWTEARIYEPHTFTENSCDTTNGDATVTHTANASIVNGIFVSGPGIPEGATVTSAASGTFELSSLATADGTNVTLTFVTSKDYVVGDLVEASTVINGTTLKTVWYCIKAHNSKTSGTLPSTGSKFWRREELCGKTLNSCRCRFHGTTVYQEASGLPPIGSKQVKGSLPFGAFLGTERI